MAASRRGLQWLFRVYKIYTLTDDFVWETEHSIPKSLYFYDENRSKLRMVINKTGRNAIKITVKKGYAWDGCTPKISFFDLFILGTPDGILSDKTGKPKAYYASLVHDALYQFLPEMKETHGITRRDADDFFQRILVEHEFAPNRIYWLAVRVFGRLFMGVRKNITRNTKSAVETVRRRKSAASK